MADSVTKQGVTYYGSYLNESAPAHIIDVDGATESLLGGWTASDAGVTFVTKQDPDWLKFMPWHRVAYIAQKVANG